MRGDEKLRQGAELYRQAADRSQAPGLREHLLSCAAELAEVAAWIEATHATDEDRRGDEE